MTYELAFDPKEFEFLEKLPKEIGKRIFEKLLCAKENPLHFCQKPPVTDRRLAVFDRCDSAGEVKRASGNRQSQTGGITRFERLAERKDYKMRVGDYRVIVDIDHEERKIQVTLIDHRKRVYKRLGRSN